jgi:prepilin-type N-terminal cleavage/methylation domain-containing protein
MSHFRSHVATERGYSLIELMMVVGIMGVLSGIAVAQLTTTRSNLRGDAAMRVVLSTFNSAKQMAIAQRRYMRVTFDASNTQISVIREDPPPATTTTTLSTVIFEGNAKFQLITGLPDTPDAFGKTAPTSFTNVVNGTFASTTGTTTVVKFAPDGTLVDWNGNPTNGTVFTAIPNANPSARAVTIMGTTGRVRGFKWDGRQWVMV